MADSACNLHFEIRPENKRIFLPPWRSTDHENPRIIGNLVMSLVRPTRVASMEVQLKGTLKKRWASSDGNKSLSQSCSKFTVFHHIQPLANIPIFRNRIYPPGRHEIPFNFALDLGDYMPETVDGVEGYSVSYVLVGHVARRFARDLTWTEQIRIYRALPLAGLQDVPHRQSIDSEWPGKVRYSFSLPNTMVPFGSAIDPSVHLEPLTEGLQIESIRIEVVEEHVFASSRFCDGRFVNRTVCPRVVADKTFCSTKDQGILQFDDTENTCDLSLAVPLPTSIHDCAQDVQSPSFDLTHKVVFTIRLINLDGYKSLIQASLPIVIYMHATNQNHLISSSLYARHIVPPAYGKHEKDQLVTETMDSPVVSLMSSTLDMLWQGTGILGRIPSYNTAIQEPTL